MGDNTSPSKPDGAATCRACRRRSTDWCPASIHRYRLAARCTCLPFSEFEERNSLKKVLGAIFVALVASVASYAILLAAGQELPPLLKNYKPVTAQRLLKPDDGDWLTIRRTYDGWGYSPLDKINT